MEPFRVSETMLNDRLDILNKESGRHELDWAYGRVVLYKKTDSGLIDVFGLGYTERHKLYNNLLAYTIGIKQAKGDQHNETARKDNHNRRTDQGKRQGGS